jgi:hypothetical protein
LEQKGNDISNNITVYETEIDNLVYQLYGLTPEEIALVESSIKQIH